MVPQLIFSKLPESSKTSRAKKLILGLQFNIDNHIISTKPTVAHTTLTGRWYIGWPSKHPQSTYKCTVYTVQNQVQVQMSSVELS